MLLSVYTSSMPREVSVDEVAFEVRHGDEGAKLALPLRMRVFVEEQSVPPEIEHDEQDARAIHALAWARDDLVGTGRLIVEEGRPVGTVGRMAIHPDWRGRGLGRDILDVLLSEACRRGLQEIRLHAQCHARGFYAKAGFEVCSDVFLEAGIEHVEMRLPITSTTAPWST